MGNLEVQEQHTTQKHVEKIKFKFYKDNDTYTPVWN
jgi:hypothetical protein